MSRTFAYARVSTLDQQPQNQLAEIKAAGFNIEEHRIVTETISGSISTSRRPQFTRLIDRLEKGDILVVTKLDRLGRDAIDVLTTVKKLEDAGIKVHCLALGGVDLTSSAGKMVMGVINAMAQFERDLLIERTQSGLAQAKSKGIILGRPFSLTGEQKQQALQYLKDGMTVSEVARLLSTSRQTIMRVRG